jgi:CelD/BcsL family acetyltransferase involved in cellulose biosynthesis
LRIRILQEIPDDRLLRQQWDALVQNMEQPEVFYTYEWAISVQRSYGSSLRPLVLFGYEDEALAGVASLALRPNGVVDFAAQATADYCDFVSSPDLRHAWCDAVFCELRKLHFRQFNLANVPADSVTASVLSDIAENYGYRIHVRPAYSCARIILGTDQDRASLRSGTTGNKAFRRNLRLLNQKGPTSFTNDLQGEDLRQIVAAFCRAHVARFMCGGRLSNIIQPERRAFLEELARQLSEQGWLSMDRLQVGDRSIAWNYGFQFGGSWFWYQPTFDTDYEHLSPGLCLLRKVIESACDDPQIRVVDLGLGAEPYKEKFANGSRQILQIVLSSSPISHSRTVLRHQVAEAIKARPSVERRVRAAMNRATWLHSQFRGKRLGAALHQLAARSRDCFAGQQEVHFFHWPGNTSAPQGDGVVLRQIDVDVLATAAMEYHADRGTLAYLLRSAQRLRTDSSRGFALVTPNGMPVHFCWVRKFENFEMQELGQCLRAPTPSAVLIFDSWSPETVRGRRYFTTTIAAMAAALRCSGEDAWIFAAAQNFSSLSGIVQAGFTYQFTMSRRRALGLACKVQTGYRPVASLARLNIGLGHYAHSEN